MGGLKKHIMNLTIKYITITIILFLFPLSFAQETFDVIAEGQGKTQREAIENALRNAVENAAGIFITSETVVQNYQLVKNKVLSYSNGIVSKYQILKSIKDNDYKVTINAVISESALKYTVQKGKLYNVDTESLYARALTEMNKIDDAINLINNFFSTAFSICWETTLDETNNNFDYDSKFTTLTYSIKATTTNELKDNLLNFLKIISDEPIEKFVYFLESPKNADPLVAQKYYDQGYITGSGSHSAEPIYVTKCFISYKLYNKDEKLRRKKIRFWWPDRRLEFENELEYFLIDLKQKTYVKDKFILFSTRVKSRYRDNFGTELTKDMNSCVTPGVYNIFQFTQFNPKIHNYFLDKFKELKFSFNLVLLDKNNYVISKKHIIDKTFDSLSKFYFVMDYDFEHLYNVKLSLNDLKNVDKIKLIIENNYEDKEYNYVAVVNKTHANIRNKPMGKTLTQVKHGTELSILERQNKWSKVTYLHKGKYKTGWIYNNSIAIKEKIYD